MTSKQKRIHESITANVKSHQHLEWLLIQDLQEVEAEKVHRAMGKSSVFSYPVEILRLDEAVAYNLIALARKSKQIARLKESLVSCKLTASKAGRIVSILNPDNADELVAFAETHSKREIECEVARRNPKAAAADKVKSISEDLVQVTIYMTKQQLENAKRAQSLESSKNPKASLSDAINVSVVTHLNKYDPVKKAERAQARASEQNKKESRVEEANELCPGKVPQRTPLTAAQKHAAFARDKGKCVHLTNGVRCNSDRWVEVHHIISVARGGSNDLSNLATLCSFHHDLVHQLSLPVEEAFNWIDFTG